MSDVKPREWWIKPGEYKGEAGEDKPFYSTVLEHSPDLLDPDDYNGKLNGFVHVIEKSAYDVAVKERDDLESYANALELALSRLRMKVVSDE